MAITFINSCVARSTDGNTFTTSNCDMTGANLLVAFYAFNYPDEPTISDSSSNSWANDGKGRIHSNNTTFSRINYVVNPTVTAAQNFTLTGTSYAAIVVLGFAGADTISPYDQHNDAESSISTLTYSSITPTENNEVVVAGLGYTSDTNTPAINGGFSTPVGSLFNGAQNYGCFAAYLIQTTAAASAPTWSNLSGGLTNNAAVQASFKASASGSIVPILTKQYRQRWS